MAQPALIGVDWGSTRCRAFLLNKAGKILARRTSMGGVANLRPYQFHSELAQLLGPWAQLTVPRLLTGMVGSARGWLETPYQPCPVSAISLSRALVHVPQIENEAPVYLTAGVCTEPSPGRVDLMRGEEVQILGALTVHPDRERLDLCLPGTHSKWACVEDGQLQGFKTAVTGELFHIVREYSMLTPRNANTPTNVARANKEAFTRGLSTSMDAHDDGYDSLLHNLFVPRSVSMTEPMPGAAVDEFMSGILIGYEVRSMLRNTPRFQNPLLVGAPELCRRYRLAFERLGRSSTFLDGELAVAQGLTSLAHQAGMMTTTPMMSPERYR